MPLSFIAWASGVPCSTFNFNLLGDCAGALQRLAIYPVVGDLFVHLSERRRRGGHDLTGRDHRVALVVRQGDDLRRIVRLDLETGFQRRRELRRVA